MAGTAEADSVPARRGGMSPRMEEAEEGRRSGGGAVFKEAGDSLRPLCLLCRASVALLCLLSLSVNGATIDDL